jgi:indolepyruvate ferredoxin oxidoreductase alpha subunit
MDPLLDRTPGKKLFLLGNEAIARGALEGGMGVAAAYPGTPSSEIGNTFARIAREAGVYFEFSTNEKVAFEVAAAASACGVRSFTFMKHVGLNVAADAYMTVAYTGVRGGFVILSADDPSCHSSQNEQDNRYYALLANIPVLEPADCQEAHDMMREAFALSERFELPIMMRTVTRMNHMRAPVELGSLPAPKTKGKYDKDPGRFVVVPATARKSHGILLQRMARAAEYSESCPWNRVEEYHGGGKLGIVAAGVGYNYAAEVVEGEKIPARILKLGLSNPLPSKLVGELIKGLDTLVVVEEMEPILEQQLAAMAKDLNPKLRMVGKASGHFSKMFEYDMDVLKEALGSALGKSFVGSCLAPEPLQLPSRPPVLCPGCPHRSTYYSVNKALKGKKSETIFSSDIGCYTLGIQPPMNAADFLLCMGSSVDASGGFAVAAPDQPTMAFLGDSTFFHSGIHGLINAVYNKHRFVYTILDNRTTAMTGHQPNPGMGKTAMGDPAQEADIEAIVRACGVKFVRVVDPSDLKATTKAYEEALAHPEVSVIIAKRACVLLEARDRKKAKAFHHWRVDPAKCKFCHRCIKEYGCPALYNGDDKKTHINPALCNGCGVCAQVCPFHAIEEAKE